MIIKLQMKIIFLIDRILRSFGHEVKKFSFSHREEYNNFYNCKYHQPDPVRKFSIYQSRNLTLAPIGQGAYSYYWYA